MSEFPHELIRQLQICSRAAAGLPGYNQEDPILPALPSIGATITSLDPTQPDLRCGNCKGKLLKGILSNICVYCGRTLQNDVVLEPISFKSTNGYQWLLTSLSLHGSEMVKPPINKTERDHGQSSPIAEIPLSDFLNFRVAWAEKEETSVSGQLVEENTKTLSLTGFPPDNFFFKFNKDASTASTEQPILHNQISTIREAPAHDTPDLFQNVKSSDLAGTSLKEERTQVLYEWEADFQFADSGNQNVSSSSDHSMGTSADSANILQDSESFDHSTVLEVDLSVHMDSLFGGAKNVSHEQPKDNLEASTALSDWNLDELGTIVSPSEPKIIVGLDNIVRSKDDHMLDTTNVHSNSVDFFDDFQWQTNNTHATENLMAVEEHKKIKHDSFDEWNGFTGSHSLQEPSGNVVNELQIHDTSLTENTTYLKENKTINDDSIDEWNDFIGSSSLQNPSENVQNESQTNATSITVTVNTTNPEEDKTVNDYTADVWNDFPGSSSLLNPSRKFRNEWQTDDAHVTENTTTNKEHETIKNDLFEEWNGFIGSSSLQEPSGNIKNELQTHNTCVENTKKLEKNEAINDEWDDFTGSNSLQVPSINVQNELQTHDTCVTENTKKLEENGAMDDEWDGFTGLSSVQDPPSDIWNEWQTNDTPVTENMAIKEDSFDEWNHFTGPSRLQIPSENVQNELQKKDTNVTENTTMPEENKAKNDYPIGEWNGFTGSSILLDHSRNFRNEWQTNDTHVTENMTMSNEHKTIKQDSFVEWNDFTGSSIQVPPENVHTELPKNDSNVTDNTTMPEENKSKMMI